MFLIPPHPHFHLIAFALGWRFLLRFHNTGAAVSLHFNAFALVSFFCGEGGAEKAVGRGGGGDRASGTNVIGGAHVLEL